ncbi:hypothetical protein K432DRAFT_358699 [Lepidopterella palustris CBS 459.81]|uniref:TFIIS N-terminal domain-containing protein n=1 Tax=Lepidopterella palustris CBS 459.81 TaxID=1314670 RepID=A0A8E2E4R5_9PEZI|nr:hypothetical protein K432DRAFT_358699 [Lepidopterella palustris CBS 459.81]
MEDVEFNSSYSHSPLPEAGHDPADPNRPEIDEENSLNPPITNPDQDVEVDEDKDGMPDPDDLEEDALSDADSALSDVDEAQFENFDIANVAIEDRPAMIDETNLNLIGVHKRKRTEGEGDGEAKKKKKRDNRREKPRRRKGRGDDEVSGGDEVEGRRSRKRKEGGARRASPDEDNDENLTPEERRRRALDRAMDAAVKQSSTRRRKKDGIDLEQMADAEIEDMRRRMTDAAQADNEGRDRGEPAQHKLKLLPEVVALLNKNTLKDSLVDPDTNLLQAVRFFLEPLNDGSLPSYNIQRELFAALAKLPMTKDSLVASGIGKVIVFYTKSKRPELLIKRQAERLLVDWTRPILKRTDDYRKKDFEQATYDPMKLPVRPSNPNTQAAQAAAARAKALETPRVWNRARMEGGPTTYTIVPKSNIQTPEQVRRAPGAAGDEAFRRMRARQLGKSGRGGR